MLEAAVMGLGGFSVALSVAQSVAAEESSVLLYIATCVNEWRSCWSAFC